MATTRAMRRLDAARDVSDADLLKMLEAATKAPSGGNSQPVRWLVVRNAAKRKQLGDIYRACWAPVREMYAAAMREDDGSVDARVLRSADHLGDHMGDAPAIVLPCSKGAPGQAESSVSAACRTCSWPHGPWGWAPPLPRCTACARARVRPCSGSPRAAPPGP